MRLTAAAVGECWDGQANRHVFSGRHTIHEQSTPRKQTTTCQRLKSDATRSASKLQTYYTMVKGWMAPPPPHLERGLCGRSGPLGDKQDASHLFRVRVHRDEAGRRRRFLAPKEHALVVVVLEYLDDATVVAHLDHSVRIAFGKVERPAHGRKSPLDVVIEPGDTPTAGRERFRNVRGDVAEIIPPCPQTTPPPQSGLNSHIRL